MNWLDQKLSDFIIITGDGKQFKVLWRNPSKSKEYHIAEFTFPGLSGSLVKRGKAKGRRYDLEFYFQGENHLDQFNDFDSSADDERPWNIIHPYYGSIFVVPIGLNSDNTSDNVTKCTCTVIETILQDSPKTTVVPVDKILSDKIVSDDAFSATFADQVKPNVSDINKLNVNNTSLYNQGVKGIKLTVDAEAYFNAFNTANAAIVNATADPLTAIREMQTMISYPFQFVNSVQNRITLLSNQLTSLRQAVATTVDRSLKKIFENNAGTLISTMAAAAATPQSPIDYQNRDSVVSIIEILLDSFNNYCTDLDSMQSVNGGNINSYIPDADSLTALNDLVSFTITNLFNIAVGAKQQRSIILEDDSNAILLCYRFYGNVDDDTLNLFIMQNNIGLNEKIQINKGRNIIYYV